MKFHTLFAAICVVASVIPTIVHGDTEQVSRAKVIEELNKISRSQLLEDGQVASELSQLEGYVHNLEQSALLDDEPFFYEAGDGLSGEPVLSDMSDNRLSDKILETAEFINNSTLADRDPALAAALLSNLSALAAVSQAEKTGKEDDGLDKKSEIISKFDVMLNEVQSEKSK